MCELPALLPERFEFGDRLKIPWPPGCALRRDQRVQIEAPARHPEQVEPDREGQEIIVAAA